MLIGSIRRLSRPGRRGRAAGEGQHDEKHVVASAPAHHFVGLARTAKLPRITDISASKPICARIIAHPVNPRASYSLDQLIGTAEDRLRHGEAERLRGLEVDDQLERRRLLDRQIGRFGAVEDLSGINPDLAISL